MFPLVYYCQTLGNTLFFLWFVLVQLVFVCYGAVLGFGPFSTLYQSIGTSLDSTFSNLMGDTRLKILVHLNKSYAPIVSRAGIVNTPWITLRVGVGALMFCSFRSTVRCCAVFLDAKMYSCAGITSLFSSSKLMVGPSLGLPLCASTSHAGCIRE